MTLVYIICGAVIFVGIAKQIMHYIKVNNPVFRETIGAIVDYERKVSRDDNRYGRGSGTSIRIGNPNNTYYGENVTYAPIIEFEVDGNTYRCVRNVFSSGKPKLGKQVRIMYNSENPSDNVEKNDWSGLFISLVGAIAIIIVFLGTNFSR